LSSAGNRGTTYLRYGSGSAAFRAGAFKSVDSRKKKMRSISTEELALEQTSRSPAESASGAYAHASAAPGKSVYNGRETDESAIVMTTEISVDSRPR
jgi:hypothetical protein